MNTSIETKTIASNIIKANKGKITNRTLFTLSLIYPKEVMDEIVKKAFLKPL